MATEEEEKKRVRSVKREGCDQRLLVGVKEKLPEPKERKTLTQIIANILR